MAISSKSLFHFTSFENLMSILECMYFQVNYSKEQFVYRQNILTYYIPIVSFCDIPLTQTREHIEEYDGFSIGLTNEWAIGHGLNPVFYINESVLTVTFENLIGSLKNNDIATGAFEHAFSFMKPFKGKNIKKPGAEEKVFYNEREWRFVPYVRHYQDKVVKQIYLTNELSPHEKEYIKGHRFFKVGFKESDIRYLITKTEKEKSDLVLFLRMRKGLNSLINHTFKVLTIDEIFSDF
jgi:hypothetical protein